MTKPFDYLVHKHASDTTFMLSTRPVVSKRFVTWTKIVKSDVFVAKIISETTENHK